MATRPYDSNPWPSQTPAPAPPSQDTYFSSTSEVEGRSVKRRRVLSGSVEARKDSWLVSRQVIVDQDLIEQAKYDCQFNSGNEVISCFPTRDTSIPQHQWATFVWNSRRPELTQTNLVNIYLFRADSRQPVLNFTGQPNPRDQAGVVTARVDDRWFGSDGENFSGSSTRYPFYWVVTRNDRTLDGNEVPQPTFTAIQTAVLDSVAAAQSSASVASAASAASASSASVASLSSRSSVVTTINGTPTTLFPSSSGSVQSPSNDDSFPRWAIAVIVILGFFAIAATGVLIFFIIRRIRRRNQAELESNRNSMGSSSPMMAQPQPESPLLGPSVLAPIPPRPASLRRNDSHGAPSLHDGASGISGEGGPFSGADAAIMADAFRKMLRKPDFAAVEEGGEPHAEGSAAAAGGVLTRELAEEGKDLRSVSSSRGFKVESHSDHGGDTQQR